MVLELVQVYPPKIASISNVQWTNIASELNIWGRGQTLQVRGIYRQGTDITGERNVHGTDITNKRNAQGTDITGERNVQGTDITNERNVQGTDITIERNVQGTDSYTSI